MNKYISTAHEKKRARLKRKVKKLRVARVLGFFDESIPSMPIERLANKCAAAAGWEYTPEGEYHAYQVVRKFSIAAKGIF